MLAGPVSPVMLPSPMIHYWPLWVGPAARRMHVPAGTDADTDAAATCTGGDRCGAVKSMPNAQPVLHLLHLLGPICPGTRVTRTPVWSHPLCAVPGMWLTQANRKKGKKACLNGAYCHRYT